MTATDDNAIVDTAVAAAATANVEVAEATVEVAEATEATAEAATEATTEATAEATTEATTEAIVEVAEAVADTVADVVDTVAAPPATEAPVEAPAFPVLPVPTAQPVLPVKKIVFALPGDTFSSKFLISWTSTISKLWETRKYDIMISPATGSFVPFVRMTTLGLDVLRGQEQKPFGGQPFDVWITIDSDIVFTYEQVEKLIEATEEHPVVAGMYRMSDLVNYAFVKEWDTSYFKANGTFKFIKPEDIEVWKKETDFKYFPVVYSGMGFMAIRKEVFDNIKYPYFDSEVMTIEADDGKVIRDICSEDVSFCKKITQAGYQIMVNTDIRVGHIKSLVI